MMIFLHLFFFAFLLIPVYPYALVDIKYFGDWWEFQSDLAETDQQYHRMTLENGEAEHSKWAK